MWERFDRAGVQRTRTQGSNLQSCFFTDACQEHAPKAEKVLCALKSNTPLFLDVQTEALRKNNSLPI